MRAILAAMILILATAFVADPQTHTFPALDTNNIFTGTNTFPSLISSSVNPASTGTLRLASGDGVTWRNAGNSTDELLRTIGAVGNVPVDVLQYSGPGIFTVRFIASTTNLPAVGGAVGLSTGDTINWRNNANGSDVALGKNSSDQLTWPNAIVSGGMVGGGTAATLTGTGACGTITTQLGGAWVGSGKCTAVTAASTLTITPGSTAPNGWLCYVQDETTRANLFQQTSHTTAACTLTITSVTQNDVFVFSAVAF